MFLLPDDIIQHAVLPFLALKDIVRLDSAIVKTSKIHVLNKFLYRRKIHSGFRVTSELVPLFWLRRRNVRLVHLYLDDSITFEALDHLLVGGLVKHLKTVRWKESRTHFDLAAETVDKYLDKHFYGKMWEYTYAHESSLRSLMSKRERLRDSFSRFSNIFTQRQMEVSCEEISIRINAMDLYLATAEPTG